MNYNFTVEIASVPDREELVAEIWLKDVMVAELSNHSGKTMIEIYPNESGQLWKFGYEEFINTLILAKKKLGSND